VPAVRSLTGALILVVALAIGIVGLDQFAKRLVVVNLPEGRTVDVLGAVLQFDYVRNPGAAFSLGIGATWLFAVIALAVAVVIVLYARRIRSRAWAVVLGLLLGGTVGNLVDRLFRDPGLGQGHVVDFIRIWGFPAIFNIADIAITGSMVTLVLLVLIGIRFDGVRHRGQPSAADS